MNIYDFINRLSQSEIKLVRKALKRDGRIHDEQATEQLLFEKILENKDSGNSDQYYASLLNINPDNNFSKIKSRLFYKILDIISSDHFIGRDDLLDATDRIGLITMKRLLQLKILRFKKNTTSREVIHHVLNDIIDTAKEYELYETLVDALKFKKSITYNVKAYKEFKKLEDEYFFYRGCYETLSFASDSYKIVVTNQNLISNFTESELDEFINSRIKQLETSQYTTVSTYIQYFYKLLKLVENERKKRYNECIELCNDMLNLLKRSKAIARNNRFGFTYDNLGQYWMLQRNYPNAISTFRRAQEYYAPKTFPYLISKEQEFYACFYGKKYNESRVVLDELLSHDKRDVGEIRYDKFLYYACCLDFITGKHKDSLRVSNLGLQIVKDKSRWEIGLRYMKILSLIELGELVEASDALESLRKQIKRLTDNNILEKRDLIIFKCLQQYERDGFTINTSPRLNYLVKRLSKKDVPWSWKYFSHELFPIHRWLRSRLNDLSQKKVQRAN